MRYTNENEIADLVRTFEAATIGRDEWKHAEHLTVALHYLLHFDIETATAKMRAGIMNLLVNGFGLDLTTEMPYHETLTIFWIKTVADFKASRNGISQFEMTNELIDRFDKNYPLEFYSREFLFSDEARSRYVAPDLRG